MIEFGAGRRQLETFLDRSCTYIASDLVDRGPGTIICDLNQRPLPDLRSVKAEVAVFSGVLEYVRDLESLIKWLSEQFSCCVASYTYVPRHQNAIQKMRDRFDRLYYGYMHSYTEEELENLFNRWGFVCTTKDTWTSQRIFLFVIRAQHLSARPKKYLLSLPQNVQS